MLDDSSEPEKGQVLTLHETNIASENRPSEKEIPVGNHHFKWYVSFRESA